MISFLSILLWNAERPRYLDILFFQTGFTGFSGCFSRFLFGQGSCWKLVTGCGLRVSRLIIFLSLQDTSSILQQSHIWIFFRLTVFIPSIASSHSCASDSTSKLYFSRCIMFALSKLSKSILYLSL